MTSSEIRKCLKCGHLRKKTEHHVLPRCHFKRDETIPKSLRNLTITLCDDCHKWIESLIGRSEGRRRRRIRRRRKQYNPPPRVKLEPHTYIVLTEHWLGKELI